MDSLTQGLLGAVSAQLGFRQRIGRDATWAAAIAAVLPDADVLFAPAMSFVGLDAESLAALKYHRGITHSIIAIPVYGLGLAAIWWWIRRRARSGRLNNSSADIDWQPPRRPTPLWLLYACVLAALMTHPLLDTCTSYGTQLLAPFSNHRSAVDSVAIIDIIYTPLLILTLLSCYVVRKLKGPAIRATVIVGAAGLLLSSAYLLAGRRLHNVAVDRSIAVAQQRGMLPGGKADIVRADAYPMIGTIFLWRGVVETHSQWIVQRIHHFSGDNSRVRLSVADKVDNEWVRAARQLEDYRTFDWFAMGRTRATYRRRDGMHVVDFHDMRYGRHAEDMSGLWALRVTFDADNGQVAESQFISIGREASARRLIKDLWSDMWTP